METSSINGNIMKLASPCLPLFWSSHSAHKKKERSQDPSPRRLRCPPRVPTPHPHLPVLPGELRWRCWDMLRPWDSKKGPGRSPWPYMAPSVYVTVNTKTKYQMLIHTQMCYQFFIRCHRQQFSVRCTCQIIGVSLFPVSSIFLLVNSLTQLEKSPEASLPKKARCILVNLQIVSLSAESLNWTGHALMEYPLIEEDRRPQTLVRVKYWVPLKLDSQ